MTMGPEPRIRTEFRSWRRGISGGDYSGRACPRRVEIALLVGQPRPLVPPWRRRQRCSVFACTPRPPAFMALLAPDAGDARTEAPRIGALDRRGQLHVHRQGHVDFPIRPHEAVDGEGRGPPRV